MKYEFEHWHEVTNIKVQGCDPKLPTLTATVTPDGDYCHICIYINTGLYAITTIRRGKAFATRVAKFMLKGFLSRLGKHRRAAKNRAAKRAKAQEEAI